MVNRINKYVLDKNIIQRWEIDNKDNLSPGLNRVRNRLSQ